MKMNVEDNTLYLTPESDKENDLIREMISSITTKGFKVYRGDVEYPDDKKDDLFEGYKMSVDFRHQRTQETESEKKS